jgi:hypothetical protein
MDCLKMNLSSDSTLPRIPFGEEQIGQRLTNFNSRYTFSAKEKDIETAIPTLEQGIIPPT